MYRRRPSVVVGSYAPLAHAFLKSGAGEGQVVPPDPLRWAPMAIPEDKPLDFIEGLRTMAVNGDPDAQTGIGIHLYLANRSMGVEWPPRSHVRRHSSRKFSASATSSGDSTR